MMKKVMVLLSIVFVLFVIGCTPKTAAKTDEGITTKPAETQRADEAAAAKAKQQADADAAAQRAAEASRIKAEADAKAKTDAQASVAGREDMFKDIHFDYDKFDIMDADKGTLKDLSKWLIANKAASVLIEGNCDERGTNEYNLALGDRRANAARDFLSASGVPASRIRTASYGEEKPVCTEAEESCWSRNRRDHFVINGAK